MPLVPRKKQAVGVRRQVEINEVNARVQSRWLRTAIFNPKENRGTGQHESRYLCCPVLLFPPLWRVKNARAEISSKAESVFSTRLGDRVIVTTSAYRGYLVSDMQPAMLIGLALSSD